MKKLILLVCCAFIATTAMAQNESYWGVRAGYNNTKVKASVGGSSESSKSLSTFQVGAAYNLALTQRAPLYLETGLYFTGRGGKISEVAEESITAKAYYLQVPVLFSWHIAACDSFSIQPFVGAYYAFGVSGKMGDLKLFKKYDEVGRIFKRSDVGLRFGVGFDFNKIYLSAGYDMGMMNIAKNVGSDSKIKNRAFFVNVGYNF